MTKFIKVWDGVIEAEILVNIDAIIKIAPEGSGAVLHLEEGRKVHTSLSYAYIVLELTGGK